MKLNKNVKYSIITDHPTEEDLKEFKNMMYEDQLKLYKYYEDDEEIDPYIPDILSAIDETLDSYYERIDRLKASARNQMVSNSAVSRDRRIGCFSSPKALKGKIDILEVLRENILNEDYTIYIQPFSLIDISDIYPVKIVYIHVYRPKFNKSTLKFDPIYTTDQIKALLVGDDIYVATSFSNNCYYISTESWRGTIDEIEKSFAASEEEIDYANPPKEEPGWKKCKECGKFFRVSSLRTDWYKSRGLEIPKRCQECRTLRKVQKEYDYQVELGRESYINVHGNDEGFDPVKYMGEERPSK